MEITKYGVCLKQLTHDKIELVRQWRNHPKISQYMEFREEITPEMQEKWFEKINTSGKDFFFIINYEGHDVGMINIKNIDNKKKCGESGIFIWDDSCLHAGVSYRAALCQRDFAFESLSLEYIVAHILQSNIRSIKYNAKFGFKLMPYQEGVDNQEYRLYKEDYFRNRQNILDTIKKYEEANK